MSYAVSVLFSEPKIPQSSATGGITLQNWNAFQCSSASRKFLNQIINGNDVSCITGFSALQRAENSSIQRGAFGALEQIAFQCSSASRKFLNRGALRGGVRFRRFQCSSASRKFLNEQELENWTNAVGVSVLFSEPKIPQSRRNDC